MNTFNTTLKILIDNDLRSQAEIAKEARVSPGTISNIVGGTACSSEILGQICHAFPRPGDGHELLKAWLIDRADEADYSEQDIRIAFGSHLTQRIPPALQIALPRLLAEMQHNPDLIELIINLSDALTSAKDSTHQGDLHVAEGPGPTNLPAPNAVTYSKASPKKRK